MKKSITLLLLMAFTLNLQLLLAGGPMPSANISLENTGSLSKQEQRQLDKRAKKMDRLEKVMEKRQDKITQKLDQIENSTESDEVKAMTQNLRYAIIAGAAAIIVSIIAGIAALSFLWIVSSILWIVAIVFLVLWLVNDVG